MRVVVFGANGQFGTRILHEALDRGHDVTAFVRVRDSVAVEHDQLAVRVGDVRSAEDVSATVQGQDAVVSAVGPGGPGTSDQHLDVLTQGVPGLVRAMERSGVRRIVAMGSVATLQVAPGLLLRDAPGFPSFARAISGAHLEAAEALAASSLDWTIVCPPVTVEAGARTGTYRVQRDFLVPGEGRISYEDVAHFVLDELEHGRHLGHRVNVAY